MKDLSQNHVHRRVLLKQLSAAGLLAAAPGQKLTALSPPPQEKRVVFVYVPGGAPPEFWMPKGCSNMFILPSVSAPLEPVKQHCVFFDGIEFSDAGHGVAHQTLGGSIGQPSVDVLLGQHLQNDAEFPNLFLASTPNGYRTGPLSYSEEGAIRAESNPLRMYQQLFERNQDEVRSVFPALANRFDSAIEDAVRESFDKTADLNIELTCLALALNKTRVLTLELGDSMQEFRAPESGIDVGYDQATHGFATPDAYIQFRTYLTHKVLYLIQLLEATPDRHGQSLLNNTLVVQIADMGDGQTHGSERLPFMLAGGKNYIANGLFLENAGNIAAVLNSVSTALYVEQALLGDEPPLPIF